MPLVQFGSGSTGTHLHLALVCPADLDAQVTEVLEDVDRDVRVQRAIDVKHPRSPVPMTRPVSMWTNRETVWRSEWASSDEIEKTPIRIRA
ncbi:hypothetical protein ACFQER_08905 [Halomicroarcula sp. GCM10025894]|uniref:hypothetical protein n=1 Tax=Halomicroarcula sp. GCM10025894 TaxID=3252673 RepID=UPI00360B9ADD